MRNEALFFNGVYEVVLEDILAIQAHLPEQILYLQPYSGMRIVHLAEDPPSTDDPVRLLMSTTEDLANVHYTCEIVGWDDKRQLEGPRAKLLNRIIYVFQWTEEGVYKYGRDESHPCVNLLHVRRMRKFSHPFSVDQLTKAKTTEALSTARTTSGGWTYVNNPDNDWLEEYL